MRALAVFTPTGASAASAGATSNVIIGGLSVAVGICNVRPPEFKRGDDRFRRKVLVHVRSFSCNYRDQSLIFASVSRSEPAYYVIGSEFAGEVVDIGDEVETLRPGDRILSNAAYSGMNLDGSRPVEPGVPSNHASAEFQVFDQAQLRVMPDKMSFTEAAGFTIGAQTAAGMVRRTEVKHGGRVLITGGRSNTSLFLAQTLRNHGVHVSVLTRSLQNADRLKEFGADEIFVPAMDTKKFGANEPLLLSVGQNGGFDYIFDPFFDIYLSRVITLLTSGGTYVTCGLFNQHHEALGLPLPRVMSDYKEAITQVMMNNLRIQGNCLGSSSDLETALADFAAGRLTVPLDSEFNDGPAEFLDRTYTNPERFGKVIYTYP